MTPIPKETSGGRFSVLPKIEFLAYPKILTPKDESSEGSVMDPHPHQANADPHYCL